MLSRNCREIHSSCLKVDSNFPRCCDVKWREMTNSSIERVGHAVSLFCHHLEMLLRSFISHRGKNFIQLYLKEF